MRKFIVTTLLLTFLVSCCALWGCSTTEPDNYKIKFVNYDDTVLYETEVVSSGAVSYSGETPTKPSDAEYSYTFAGWADEDGIVVADFPAATKDATYKATFNRAKRSYTATFVVDGNTVRRQRLNTVQSLLTTAKRPQETKTLNTFTLLRVGKSAKPFTKRNFPQSLAT